MSMIHGKRSFCGQILTVIGMAAALTACGGSSGSDSASVTAASTSGPPAIINPTASSTPSGAATSASSNTMVTNNASSRIVDKAKTVWTVKSGVVYEQPSGTASAAAAGFSANVQLLYYFNGVVYQENSSCSWWSWSGSAWVASSNPAPTATPACPATAPATAATTTAPAKTTAPATTTPAPASSGFGIKVAGNTFTDLSGNVVQLQGENVSALEVNSSGMWDAFYGTNLSTWQTLASTWQLNIIRLPLNEWAWRANATSAGGKPYRTIVATAVANITAAHMYVILDLHWAAPNDYNGGVADGQPGYLNADNSANFWSSIASTFKSNPAVLFELFNEPIADGSSTTWNSSQLQILKDNSAGATFTFYDAPSGGNFQNTGHTFTPAGHQQCLNAIRATGATNVILWSTTNWNNNMSQSLSVRPTDTLSPSQLGATIHYGGGSITDWQKVLDAGYPILETELYQPNISGQSSPSGYAWLKSKNIGYVMWGANNWNSSPDLRSLINNSPWSYNGASLAW